MEKQLITVIDFISGQNVSSQHKLTIARKLKKNPITIYKWVKLAMQSDNFMYYHKKKYIIILSDFYKKGQ
jgi:hypothetical protein